MRCRDQPGDAGTIKGKNSTRDVIKKERLRKRTTSQYSAWICLFVVAHSPVVTE